MPRFLLSLLVLVVPCSLVAQTSEKSPQKNTGADSGDKPTAWTPQLLFKVKSTSSVQASPDGKRVAFTVREAVMEGEKSEYLTQIHLANVDGSDSFQLTFGDKSSDHPHWSPDGEWIAFISSRSGKDNIWLIRARGGEAQQLTDVKSGVASFKWSPDGKAIAFTATDAPSALEEKATKERNDARVVDENVKMSHLFVIPMEKDSKGKREARQLTKGNLHVGTIFGPDSFDWSPSGKTIVFSHTRTPKADDWTSADISLVDVANATIRPLVNTKAAERSPLYSPDGRWVAYVASDMPPTWGFNATVHVVPAEGGTARELAETTDRNPRLIGWSADGQKIYYAETAGTRSRLYALPLDGKPVEVSQGDGVLGNFALNQSRSGVGFSREETNKAPEAYVSRLDQFEPKQVSRVNKDLPALPLGRTEVLRWKSADNLEVEGLLTYPVDYEKGKRYPLLLVIHGGPSGVFTQNFIANVSPYPVAVFAARGYAVLRSNPRGSSGYGKTFRYANYKDWGGGDFKDLMAGVEHVINLGIVDADHLGVMGGVMAGS